VVVVVVRWSPCRLDDVGIVAALIPLAVTTLMSTTAVVVVVEAPVTFAFACTLMGALVWITDAQCFEGDGFGIEFFPTVVSGLTLTSTRSLTLMQMIIVFVQWSDRPVGR
jgi:hypothetical protein